MRKQILIIVCVAVVSFLLGTLVSMGLTANGIVPNPFETSASKTQTVRFTEADEINVTMNCFASPLFATTVSFVWTPKSPQSNIILSICCHFVVRWEAWTGDGEARLRLLTRIYAGGFHGYESNEWETETLVGNTSDWASVRFQVNEFRVGHLSHSWIRPNQQSYNFTVLVGSWSEQFATPTYIKDTNIIMEVIDG